VRIPRHAREELLAYLDCGLLCRGFARLKCRACPETRLVAFSCKGRGFCPSCMGRRMAATAANLVERVLPPATPLRQWVLTFPFPWRPRLAQEREACPWGTANRSGGSPNPPQFVPPACIIRSCWPIRVMRQRSLPGRSNRFSRDPEAVASGRMRQISNMCRDDRSRAVPVAF